MTFHICATSILRTGELGGVLPEVTPTSLEQATMRLVRLIGKFAKSGRLDQLLEINEDGRITAEERPLHDAIMARTARYNIHLSRVGLRHAKGKRPGRHGPRLSANKIELLTG